MLNRYLETLAKCMSNLLSGTCVNPAILMLLALLLLGGAYILFRNILLQDYLLRGKLSKRSGFLQLVVFAGLMALPYLFNSPDWPWFWKMAGPTSLVQQILGFLIILLGFLVAFGTMARFGLQRAFGIEVSALIDKGPYLFTRNPQIIGGYLLVIGTTIQWPSLYGAAWVVLYGIIGHWMILTEEEHLGAIYGSVYREYCGRTPRYLVDFHRRKRQRT